MKVTAALSVHGTRALSAVKKVTATTVKIAGTYQNEKRIRHL